MQANSIRPAFILPLAVTLVLSGGAAATVGFLLASPVGEPDAAGTVSLSQAQMESILRRFDGVIELMGSSPRVDGTPPMPETNRSLEPLETDDIATILREIRDGVKHLAIAGNTLVLPAPEGIAKNESLVAQSGLGLQGQGSVDQEALLLDPLSCL